VWSAIGGGVNRFGYIAALAANGSDLYVGGHFARAGNVSATNIARWDGTNWHALGGGIYDDPSNGGGIVTSIAVHGQNVYAAGRFSKAGDVTANQIAMWDGVIWSSLGTGLTGPINNTAVQSILVHDNAVFVSGSFSNAGVFPSRNFAVWHLPAPHINVTTNQIEVRWWKGFTNYVLEASDTLPASNWTPIATPPNTNYYSAPASGSKKFFRLRRSEP